MEKIWIWIEQVLKLSQKHLQTILVCHFKSIHYETYRFFNQLPHGIGSAVLFLGAQLSWAQQNTILSEAVSCPEDQCHVEKV